MDVKNELQEEFAIPLSGRVIEGRPKLWKASMVNILLNLYK